MNLVVVESPAKAKTINKYLGPGYEVLASFGHVRDLPAKNGSVDPDADFRMIWEVDAKAQKRLNDIARAVKAASDVEGMDRKRQISEHRPGIRGLVAGLWLARCGAVEADRC